MNPNIPLFRRATTLAPVLLASLLCVASNAPAAPMVTFAVHEHALDIRIGNQRVAEYVWQDPDLPRPYFRQLTAADGTLVSRNYPPDPVADQANDDHAHYHPGAWLAFGDAAGADFWRNKARVEHVTFIVPPRSSDGTGYFEVVNAYQTVDPTPKTHFLETCTYTIVAIKNGYLLTSNSEFKPEGAAFAFGDQEEMGFGVRLATPLTVKHGGGHILNSAGGEQEAGTWGKNADWCAGFNTVNGQTAGMCVMASPENFRPAWFHSRDYGLITANPFGKKAMTAPKNAAVPPDSTPVPADGTLRVGFAVYVFSAPGDVHPDFNAVYDRYTRLRPPPRD